MLDQNEDTSETSCSFLSPPPLAPILRSTPTAQILASKYCCSLKRTRAPWEKWLIPELGQEKHNLGLEHLVLSESKKVLKKQETSQKGTETILKGFPMVKSETI